MSRLVEEVESLRAEAFGSASPERRSVLGQFPTPPPIAMYMASMLEARQQSIQLLDAGAGVGTLTAAFVADICRRETKPTRLNATAFEVDDHLAGYLKKALHICDGCCRDAGIEFSGNPRHDDFIEAAVEMIDGGLFGTPAQYFDCAILNPPYKKISTDSPHRRLLRKVGIETTNLYAAFLGLAVLLLKPGGELVAITPRSFCNGPYFKPFRQLFLREMSLRQIHLFESRSEAFCEDEVLQENIIFRAVKTAKRATEVMISSSHGPSAQRAIRNVSYEAIVKSGDPDQFIHIVPDEAGGQVSDLMSTLAHSLADLGLSVSTGRVVEFRSRSFIQSNPGPNTVPLIYPTHFSNGWIAWPRLGHKKPNACLLNDESAKWLVPAAVHVLVKRFSAKEERRRVVASVFDPVRVPCQSVAFENHLNYFHENGNGLQLDLAKGLAAFLNSTLVDTYFRQFNGHTQVNATDLRSLKYPARSELDDLGRKISEVFPGQKELDRLVERELKAWRRDQQRQSSSPH